MRILVTRPEPEATRFATQLREHGIEALIAPLMIVEPIETPLPALDDVRALVFTSANGVRAYAARGGPTDLPAYTVGEATAAAARAAGFAKAISAGSDWHGLLALLASDIDPARGTLLHVAGEEQAGDLVGALKSRGFDAIQVVVYRAAAVTELPLAAREALLTGSIDGVALFSPRSAAIFLARANTAGLTARLNGVDAYCLSRAVAEALEMRAFRAVRVAARPNAEALIALMRAEDPAREDRHNMNENTEPAAGMSEAERIVAAFGGIRPMAKALGIAVTTVQGWKERGAIPLKRMGEIRDSAVRAGIDLDAALAESEPAEPVPAPPAPKPEPKPESIAAEKVTPPPEPGLRAAETAPPPPPQFDAPRETQGGGRRWAMFGAGFGAAFVAGALLAALIGLGGGRSTSDAERSALDRMQARIDRLTSQLEEQQKRQQGEAATLQTRLNRIDAAERAVGEQRERVAAVAASAAALASRLERLDADVKALTTRAPAGPDEVRTLREQVDALTKRFEALPKDVPDVAALVAQMKQSSDKLAALERRLGEVAQARSGDGEWKSAVDRVAADARAAGEKLAADVERVKQDLATVQGRVNTLAADLQRAGGAGNEAGALIAAIGQLRRAVADGTPYRPALDAVAALAREKKEFAPALAALATRAERGVPTTAQLRERFDRTAVAVQRAAAVVPSGGDMWDRIWARLQTLVIVRRVGEVPGDAPAARLSRAEAALARGDLAETVKQMEGLAGPPREAAAAWLADAKGRLEVEAALAELDRTALALLRAPESKAKP